ncbi:DNA methyltransferase [Anaeromyxobacter sp. SG17]|uniref:DNA methyltransferase n=1 Tax=Anaeromyxobacter sp. SG17 TaxID=2925405 RepID=UPI001F56DDF2|nr:DNA methyltransferase [Anaeromyxobacter sp. SG17]
MASQAFKSIYFPPERTAAGIRRRLTLAFPLAGAAEDAWVRRVLSLSSPAVRQLLGDPTFETLEVGARQAKRSLNNHCLYLLSQKVAEMTNKSSLAPSQQQLALVPDVEASPSVGLTFRDSKRLPFHRWYPYVEGFSAEYVANVLARFPGTRTVYDPFGGGGTTLVEASARGIPSGYSEVNPFMRFVAETKVNAAAWARQDKRGVFAKVAAEFQKALAAPSFKKFAQRVDLGSYMEAFEERDFFEEQHLRELLASRDLARSLTDHKHARALLLLSIASNVVRSSHMTRRADLRRRRPDEYKNRVVDVPAFITERLKEIVEDLSAPNGPTAEVELVSGDAREASEGRAYSLFVTSPPYLNGTNYFRNTKLELWLLGWLKSESELGTLHRSGITAGINSVSRKRADVHAFDGVDAVARELEGRGDKRIPLLVRQYFSDMHDMFKACRERLEPGGRFVLDIGDSKFYGVYVPTDTLLVDAAVAAGFELESSRVLARRYSYDRSKLQQVELVLRNPKAKLRPVRSSTNSRKVAPSGTGTVNSAAQMSEREIRDAIELFRRELPYTALPYSKRNWGHARHSLCSYQGKFKPAIAHWLVKLFTTPGATVVDPLGGVGTVAFEAAQAARNAVTCDLSPLAYAVATGKVEAPSSVDVDRALGQLEKAIAGPPVTEADRKSAAFGLNGAVEDFYHPRTLEEVLKARRYYLELERPTAAELFVKASLLHVLHGNRPYALSRTSHPITPFHPSGPAKYKPLVVHVRKRVSDMAADPLPPEFMPGKSYHRDFRELPRDVRSADAIITSPPFLGMRFDRPNWLRMWFCGWGETDFHTRSLGFLERQQTRSLDVYSEFFDACSAMLRSGGVLIVHLGGSGHHRMVEHLQELMAKQFRMLPMVTEDVTSVEKHGIKDKGLTTTHNFLFGLRP